MNRRFVSFVTIAMLMFASTFMDADAQRASRTAKPKQHNTQLRYLTPQQRAAREAFLERWGISNPYRVFESESNLKPPIEWNLRPSENERPIELSPRLERHSLREQFSREFFENSRLNSRMRSLEERYGNRQTEFEVIDFWLAGTRGDLQRWYQEALGRTTNADLRIDGILGSATEAAVRAFQTSRGLAVDGVIGKQTREALAREFPIDRRHLGLLRDRTIEGDVSSVVLDFEGKGADTRVTVWTMPTNSSPTRMKPNTNWKDVHFAHTPEVLRLLLAESRMDTVVYRGASIPAEYRAVIGDRTLLRQTEDTTRKTIGEVVEVAGQLQTATFGSNAKVFDALPGADRSVPFETQLARMNFDKRHADLWRRETAALRDLRSESIEVSTRSKVLDELQNGTNSTVIIVGHVVNGSIVFPNGQRLSPNELRGLPTRDERPERKILILGCETAQPRGIAEVIVEKNFASYVVAPREPVTVRDSTETVKRISREDQPVREVLDNVEVLDTIVDRKRRQLLDVGFALSDDESIETTSIEFRVAA